MESRRDFIRKAGLLTGALGIAGILPASIQRAMAIDPRPGTTFLDAEYVVFLMQENRSFDHAFGSLKGVRGFNDPRAITLPDQYPVWLQRNKKGETYPPFRLNIKDTRATWMSALPHSWENQVDARNNGKYDGWLEAKRSGNKAYADMPLTMGYYNREDIPFYYSLADAFTVCDHNFCSALTGTSPNRCFFWTGKIREQQNATSLAHHSNGYIDGAERLSWSTFPERLSKHNVNWKIYQNELSVDVGLEGEANGWLSNFTDNDMEFFKQYHVKRHPEHLVYLRKAKVQLEEQFKNKPDPKLKEKLDFVTGEINFLEINTLDTLTPEQRDLHKRAFVTNRNDPDFHQLETITYNDKGTERTAKIPKGDVLHQFRTDVDAGKLPAVSWLVAPCNFSDHPAAPWYGAWYLSETIDILTKNPEVWKKTIFILTYDENDGYFDHLPPFVAPDPKDPATGKVSASLDSSAEYIYKGADSNRKSPVGLGFRVPMVVVSPWSRGGYVNSQVFDHTSCIQFLEHFLSHKTGEKIYEDNISSWRRSLCGDLTSVFRPYNGENIPSPEPVQRIPFLTGIHKAKFEKLPDNFRSPDKNIVADILKSPILNPNLARQEKGIKPANTIPYELYANGVLDVVNKQFKIDFTAGDRFFGAKAKGAGFIVYGADNNWSFTVDKGDTLSYQWPLHSFQDQAYMLKVYSANGFYRCYKGNAKDPEIALTLSYQTEKNSHRASGNVLLHIKRLAKGRQLKLTITDNSYGKAAVHVVLNQEQHEIFVPLDIKANHCWYDFTVTLAQYSSYSQQFAGHVEHAGESFTDPLMGNVM
ncbi:phosphocholine-specific phospholipase C [Pedobacter heparinus]|uniref:phospholipase C n=1 Tax=Pedobacter heparinus (strain ATCC 13125 / DSM 2366 / CIP 104194 / JCM 7457 / NBRC 12017 / NCIMB 9290 / NRRL B-14731 / HIM 762-3) TaxID=485917 RepID=C6XS52_PEDHD|nr:phospholipase C, phosphocholine-specific [Pedobacter heparinus]ACU03397.1 phospholipase C, phosphocholine-specific [Pedobacter heparinus DSM 2366]